MFLHKLGSSDFRFKTLQFHAGMNILLADKTVESTSGDSRNGAGKSSFVRILRYILGGSLAGSLKSDALSAHSFCAEIDICGAGVVKRVERPVSPKTKVYVDAVQISVEDWKRDLSDLLGVSDVVRKPTVSQIFGQLARDYFEDPLKTYRNEGNWESGMRIGFLLGFSPEILVKAAEIIALEKNQKTLRKAISDGVFGSATASESELRARLAQERKTRDRVECGLKGFRVDEQYAVHQVRADELSRAIRELNDEGLSLEKRRSDLEAAMSEERPAIVGAELSQQLETMYAEIGIIIPDVALRRFVEVADFHASVVRNRRIYLENEFAAVNQRLEEICLKRKSLDRDRASVMAVLNESMALDTFRSMQKELADLDARVADLEKRLELVQSVSDSGIRLRAMKSEVEYSLRAEIAEREVSLESSIALFQQLGEEIYSDRRVSLLIEATSRGVLKVEPRIDGDASAGIQGVKTFLLDLVCLVSAIRLGRAPRILVHDSQLFDSMDDRQIASCLNIGARLADIHGFQYIVTLNSDRLAAAEAEGFDRMNYVIDPELTDAGDGGGLFGFRFF